MPRSRVGRHSSDATASSSERVGQTTPSSCLPGPSPIADMSDQSYDNIPRAASDSSDELDSLPSTSASTTSISPSEEEWQSDAEREWKESLQQLELLLTMVLVPYLGKYFGRKAAYWGWTKYMEWKYPVHIEITNPGLFKGIGAVEAAASL
ncbi:hypothetical protein D6C78_07993 [Aureobasidium pullulans]|uniref:Uncharacterized protein n=1 Tax=Aureobasidium pullulans TaxID=5580 RepID=A0A4T0BES5_AURPU|nr:hypothetical protein D6C78_07993 [Aureobasidium pullulans]